MKIVVFLLQKYLTKCQKKFAKPLNITLYGGFAMTQYSTYSLSIFKEIITEMSDCREKYVVNPEKDFTRNGNQSFINYMLFLCTMTDGTYSNQSYSFHNKAVNFISASAICQARQKIKPSAFDYVYKEFNRRMNPQKTYKGYKVYAVDGSDIPICRNPNCEDQTYIKKYKNRRGYNSLHLNAIYDINNKIYVDAILDSSSKFNEYAALVTMAKRSIRRNEKSVYICDRGYEAYNCIGHLIDKNVRFLIRAKDINSNGIAKNIKVPDTDTFDIYYERTFTKSCKKIYKENKDKYRIIASTTPMDFITEESPLHTMGFRVVRILLESGEYELLFTNLDKKEFPALALKDLYYQRWGIETAFRDLKHTVGAVCFHSKKVSLIEQELYASLFVYNFSSLVAQHVKIDKKKRKYKYYINFSMTVTLCRDLLKSLAHTSPPENVEATLKRKLSPVRPDRKFKRFATRGKSWICFNYRVA